MCPTSNYRPAVHGSQYLLFGFVQRFRLSDGTFKLKFLWRRILLLVAVLILFAWLSVAALLHAYFKYKRNFSEVAYTDMLLLPIRMAEHRKKMGHYHIEKGLSFYEKKEYNDAFRCLRLGLINAPEHLEGRTMLAKFYRDALRRPELAIDVAIKGLDYGGLQDSDFLRFLFSLMSAENRDQQIWELVEQHLPSEAKISHINQIMAFAAANAYYLRGHYDEAEKLLIDYKLTNLPDKLGLVMYYMIKWARGEKRKAINDLEMVLNRFPNNDLVLKCLLNFYEEDENYDRARQLVLLWSLNAPAKFGPKLKLLQMSLRGDRSELGDRFDGLYEAYRSDKGAIMRLAEFAAQHGMIEKSKDLYLQADGKALNKDLLAILLLRSYLQAGEYRQGIEFASTLPKLNQLAQVYKSSLLTYAYYALAEDALAELSLKSFLQFANVPAQDYLMLAKDLIAIERQDVALDLLKKALELDDDNQAVLAAALKLELELSDLQSIQALLEPYLTLRGPNKILLQACYDKLVSDRFMFEKSRTPLLTKLRASL